MEDTPSTPVEETITSITSLENISKGALAYLEYDDSPNKEELEALVKLREELSKLDDQTTSNKKFLTSCSDALCIRYLRGHHLNIPKIVTVMQEAAKWRLDHDTDNVIAKWEADTSQLSTFFKGYLPFGHIGRDYKGKAVTIQLLTHVDFLALAHDIGNETVYDYLYFLIERNFVRNPNGGCMQIIDLGSLPNTPLPSMFEVKSWINALVAFLKGLAKPNDLVYPEAYQRIVITRPPGMFSVAFALIKPFLPERTKEKIIVLNEKDAFSLLKGYMDESVIPEFLGGKNKLETIGLGGKLPENFLKNSEFMENISNHVTIKEAAYERIITATSKKD